MSRIGCHPDVFGISELHDAAHVFFPLQRPPDVGMGGKFDSHGDGLPADLIEGVGESFELIVARTAGRTLPHIDLVMAAATRLEKIAGEGYVIANGLRD